MKGEKNQPPRTYVLFPSDASCDAPPPYVVCSVASEVTIALNGGKKLSFSLVVPPSSVNWYGAVLEGHVPGQDAKFQIFHAGDALYLAFPPSAKAWLETPTTESATSSDIRELVGTHFILAMPEMVPLAILPEKFFFQAALITAVKAEISPVPDISGGLSPEFWRHSWVPLLYRYVQADPSNVPPLTGNHFRVSQPGYLPFRSLSAYDRVLLIEDLIWARPHKVRKLLADHIRVFSTTQNAAEGPGAVPSPWIAADFPHCPLVLPHALLNYSKYSGDFNAIEQMYDFLCSEIAQWEGHWFLPNRGLFYFEGPPAAFEALTHDYLSPRFHLQASPAGFRQVPSDQRRKLVLVDINAQICDYYQNLGVFGMLLGKPDFQAFFEKAERLQAQYQQLWDPETEFFYDLDLETGGLQKIKTNAAFWALFGGIAAKSVVQPLIAHLISKVEFGGAPAVPHVAFDQYHYFSSIALNAGSLARDYWIICGLRKYNYNSIAAQIATRSIRHFANQFKQTGGLAGSVVFDVRDPLMTTGAKADIPPPGHYHLALPLHALFYTGILGAEILDDSVNFVPSWEAVSHASLGEEIRFTFQYRGKTRVGRLSKDRHKIFEITPEIPH